MTGRQLGWTTWHETVANLVNRYPTTRPSSRVPGCKYGSSKFSRQTLGACGSLSIHNLSTINRLRWVMLDCPSLPVWGIQPGWWWRVMTHSTDGHGSKIASAPWLVTMFEAYLWLSIAARGYCCMISSFAIQQLLISIKLCGKLTWLRGKCPPSAVCWFTHWEMLNKSASRLVYWRFLVWKNLLETNKQPIKSQ